MSDDDDTTTSGGAGHYYYSGGGGGATNAFRQHLAKQLGGGDGDDAPLTRLQPTGAGGNRPSPLSPSRNTYNYGVGNNNNNQRDVGYNSGGGDGDGASSSSPSAHIKISALKEQVSRLEEALCNTGGGMGGGGGGGSASEVLEGKYMEVVKKNRDITVRYESERSKVTKLMRQIVALEEKNMVLQQEGNVTLPSQQPQSARGNGGYGVQNNGGEAPPADDAESIAKQLKKDLDISTKSLVLFRKQCDEQKREIVRMRKILLKELGDEATLGRAQAAIGGEDDMLDDNVSLAGSVAASTVTTRTDGRGGGGQPTWKGRAEQIQLLNMKVKTLQRKLERGVVPPSEDASAMDDGVSVVSGTTARRGGPAPSVATRDYDDVHTVMLENKASQKRQELDDAKQTIKKLEEALGKERTKAEGLSSRMRIVEKDSQSLKGNLQTLIGKACNDDALIASYKERLEGLREENKVLVEKIKDEARKQRERGEKMVSAGSGGGSTLTQSQQGQVDSAMLQGLRRQVSKLEQQNSTLLAEVDEMKHDLLRAQAAASARPPSGNGAMAAKSRRRKGSGTTTGDDDSSDEEVGTKNKKPTNTKASSIVASSRFSWLVDPATGELTKLTAAASSSSMGNASPTGSTHAAIVEAIARAADVILSQRAAIQFYEKRAQKHQQQRAADKSGDRLITEENQYLRERIKMLTDQNTREATVLQGNFTQLLERVLQSISSENRNLEPATRGSPSTTTSRQAWPSQQNSTPREQPPPPTQSNSSSSVGGFLPSIVPTKASTPILASSKGAIRADTEPPTLGRANTADVALGGSRPGKSGGAVSVSAVATGSGGPRKGTAEASVGRTNKACGDLPVKRRDNTAMDEQDGMEPMSYAEAQRLAIEARERKEALLNQKRKEAGGGSSITPSSNEDFYQQAPSRRRFDDGVDNRDGPVIDSDGEEESAHTALVSRKHAPPQPMPTRKTKAPTASRSQQQPSGTKPVVARDVNNRKPQPSPPPPSQQSSPPPPPPPPHQQFSIVDPLEAQAKLAGGHGGGRGGGGGIVASIGVKISDPVPKKKQQPSYVDSDDDDDSASGRGGGGMPTYGDETPGEGYSITPRSDYGGDDDPSFWVGEENTNTNGARRTGGGIKSNATTAVTRPPPKQQRKPATTTTTTTNQQQSPSSFAPGVLPTYRPSGGSGGVDSPTTPSDSQTGYANQFASRGRNLGGAMPGATRARF